MVAEQHRAAGHASDRDKSWEMNLEARGMQRIVDLVPAILKRRQEVKDGNTRAEHPNGEFTRGELADGWTGYEPTARGF